MAKTKPLIKRNSKGKFVSGGRPWNTGTVGIKPATPGSFKAGEMSNEKHFQWKGDKASYSAKHYWVSRHFGKPRRMVASYGIKLFVNFGFFYALREGRWLFLMPTYSTASADTETMLGRAHRFVWLCFELQLVKEYYKENV